MKGLTAIRTGPALLFTKKDKKNVKGKPKEEEDPANIYDLQEQEVDCELTYIISREYLY